MSTGRVRLTALMLLCAAGMGFTFNGQVFAAKGGEGDSGEATGFARIFSDHMVLQREQPIRVWGRAKAHTKLTIKLANESKNVKSDAEGNWKVDMAAMSAGGPYTLSLLDATGLVQTVSDILIGDVWLCSGQSNMELTAGEVNQNHAPPRTAGNIRLMKIPQQSSAIPLTDYVKLPGWAVADAGSIHDFSAVCYLLAYELQKTDDIPFGLIAASWGGSAIKTWISARELKITGGFEKELGWLHEYGVNREEANRQFGQAWENWWKQVNPSGGHPWTEPASELSGWNKSPEVMGNWRMFGDPELAAHLGMVWFRKSFDLTESQASQDAVLALGGIDEVDYLWINGRFIGSTFGYGTERYYEVPEGTFQAGTNTITVNVLNTWDAGGMVGPNDHVQLSLSDDQKLALGDDWFYRKVPAEISGPPRTPWESLGGLGSLSNAMIAPLEGLGLAGAIWYQGETDAGNPRPYETLLTSLTQDWRELFDPSLPFLIVQLPGFGNLPMAPAESGWAAIRDAQRRVANGHDKTGLVVTIDTGDVSDLHPPDKRRIGKRAAEVARILAYGKQGLADGLSPAAAYRHGGDVVVDFDPAVEKLVVVSATAPISFELCGDKQGDCVYADSRIEGNRIFLTAPDSDHATRVRHCWADAPICNLYGVSGLPVSSFEIQVAPHTPSAE